MPQTGSREKQRIAKLLARAGIASRREIERMIAEGRVALNGEVLTTPATLLASLHGVTVDGNPVAAPAPARLYRFHKPVGLLTTERDPAGRRTIYDALPAELPRLVPVGRLDLNTEGLLLLTSDGELKRQLELPATGIERSYRARAYGQVTQAQLEELIEGVTIEGVRYGSIDANLERRTGANFWIELTLTEGKNREVRRVLEHLGLKVSRLIRTRYGPFHLGDLEPGEVDEVRQHDLVAFRKALAGAGGGKAASNLQLTMRPKVRPEAKPQAAEPAAPNRSGRRAQAAKAVTDAPKPGRAATNNRSGPASGASPSRPGAAPKQARSFGARARAAEGRPKFDAKRAGAPGSTPQSEPEKPEDKRKPRTREEAAAEDRAAFVDRPRKRYRATDRRPRRPAADSPRPPRPRAPK